MSKVVRDLTFVSRCGARYRNRELEPLGLSARQAQTLLEICRKPGISQDELARSVALDKSNITRQAAALEENGLVLRTACLTDKRLIQLNPTDTAVRRVPQIQAVAKAWEEYVTEEFSPEELQTLEGLLGRMKQRARRWMEAD